VEKIDNCISAEIPPDPNIFPRGSRAREEAERLQRIVLTNLIHGGCTALHCTALY
jgi:hypothetical protein